MTSKTDQWVTIRKHRKPREFRRRVSIAEFRSARERSTGVLSVPLKGDDIRLHSSKAMFIAAGSHPAWQRIGLREERNSPPSRW